MTTSEQHTPRVDEQFTISINLGNEAMQTPEDVASALRQVARNITETPNGWTSSCPILDANGNSCGKYGISFEYVGA